MFNANRRLLLFLIVGFVVSAWACGITAPTPTSPLPTLSPNASSIASNATASSAATPAATSATPDVAATEFVRGLSPEQAAVYAAVQTRLPSEPARWLVAMNETLIAQPALTATPLPFPVVTEVGQFGVRYRFADPAEVERIRDVYERYWDFISFRDGPPPENLTEALAQHLAPSPQATFSNGECMYADVLGKIEEMRNHGLYLRASEPIEIAWGDRDDDVFLFAGGVNIGNIEVSLHSRLIPRVQVALVESAGERVLKMTTTTLALVAHFEFASQSSEWRLVRDGDGLYCGAHWTDLETSGWLNP